MEFYDGRKQEMFIEIREFIGTVYDGPQVKDVEYDEYIRDTMYKTIRSYVGNIWIVEHVIDDIARVISNLRWWMSPYEDKDKELDKIAKRICGDVEREFNKWN